MARERFTLEILADIQNAVNPIQKIAQLLRIFDEAQVVDVITSPNINTAIQKINELSASATKTREEANLLASEFRTATNGLNLGTVGTEQARKLADTFKLNTERFRELRTTVKAGAKDIGLDPNAISGFQSFDQALTQVQNKIRALSTNITRFGFNERTLSQVAELNTLVSQLSAQFPQLAAAIEKQLIQPFGRSSVAVQNVRHALESIKSADAFTALQNEAEALRKRMANLRDTANGLASGGIGSDKAAQNFANATAQADALAQRLQALKQARSEANVLGLDPEQLSRIDNMINNLEVKLASIKASLAGNAQAASAWANIQEGTVASAEVLARIEKEVRDARRANNTELADEQKKLAQIVAERDRLRQLQASGTIDSSELQRLTALESEYDRTIAKVDELAYVQKTLNVGYIVSENINAFQKLRETLLSSKQVTSEVRDEFLKLTGIRLPADNAEAHAFALERVNRVVNELRTKYPEAAQAADRLNSANFNNGATFKKLESQVKDFNYYMEIAIEKIIRYRVAFIALQRSVQAIKSTLTISKDIESAFANIAKVTLGTSVSIDELRKSALSLGQDFGRSIKDVTDIMFIWSQQGKTQNEILALTKSTLAGVVGANLDAQQAVETLTAAQRIYNLTADDSIIVFDKLLNVQRQFAVTTKDLADALKLLGVTAEEFGIDMDSLFGQITSVVQVTRKTGQQVANSLKTIFAKFLQTDSVSALRDIGVAVFDLEGGLRPLGDTLDELSEKWDTLSSTQRLNIARLLGGIRHYTQFLVLMDQYPTALAAAAASQQSAGFALKATNIELNTLANQIERTKAIFTDFGNSAGNAVFGLKNQLEGLNTIVEKIHDVFELPIFKQIGQGFNQLGAVVLFVAEAMFLGGSAAFLAGAAMRKWRDSMASQVIPTLVAVDSTIGVVNRDIELHGVAALDAALTAAKATDTERREIIKLALTMDQATVATYQLAAGNISFTGAANAASVAAGRQATTIAATGRILSREGKQIISTSANLGKLSVGFGGLVRLLGGPVGAAVFTAASVIGILGIAFGDTKKELDGLNDSIEQNVGDLLGLVSNIEKLTKISVDGSLKGRALVERLHDLRKEGKDTSVVMNELRGLLASLSFNPEIKAFDISSLTGTNATEAEIQLLGLLDANIRRLGDDLAARSQIAEQAYTRQKSAAEEYLRVVGSLTQAQNKAITARANISNLVNRQQFNIAADYLEKQQRITNEIARQKARIAELIDAGENEVVVLRAKARLNKLVEASLQAQRAFTGDLTAQNSLFRELQDSALEFVNAIYNTDNKDLSKVVFGDKDPRKEIKNIAEDLAKEMQKQFNETGTFSFEGAEKNVPGLQALAKVTGNLDSELTKASQKYENITAAVEKYLKVSRLALPFTAEELEKLNDRLAKYAANAQFAFANVQNAIRDSIEEASASNEKTTFFDIAIKQQEKVKDAIDETVNSLKVRIEQAKIEEQIRRTLAKRQEDRLRLELNALATEKTIYQNKLNQARLDAGLSEEEAKYNEQFLRDNAGKIKALDELTLRTDYYARQLRDTVPDVKTAEEMVSILDDMVRKGTLNAEAAEIMKKAYEETPQILNTRVQQLEEELRIAEGLTSAQRERNRAELDRLRDLKAILEVEKERNRLISESTQKDIDAIGEVFSALDRSQGGVEKNLAIQSNLYQTQLKLVDALADSASLINSETFDHAGLIAGVLSGTITWGEAVASIKDAYGENNKAGERALENLNRQTEKILFASNLTNNRLKQSLLINTAATKFNNTIETTNKLMSTIGDIGSDIGTILGDNTAKVNEEIRALEQTKLAHIAINEALDKSLAATSSLGERQREVVQGLKANLQLLNTELNVSIEILGKEFKKALIELEPFLVDMNQLAGQIATSFAGAFVGINESLVGRFEDIADQQDNIIEKTRDIEYLNKQLAAITDVNSDAYKNVKAEIQSAEIELENMNREMDRLSNAGKIVKSVFGDFAKTIGDLVVEVQTDALKKSIENALTETTVGKTISNAFLNGSQVAANTLVEQMRQGFAAVATLQTRLTELTGQALAEDLVTAILLSSNDLTHALDSSFNLFIRKWAEVNKLEVPDELLNSTTEPISRDDIRQVVDGIEAQTLETNTTIRDEQKLLLDTAKDIVDGLKLQLESSKDINAGVALLRAAIPLISKDLGVILATKVFGPGSAKGASTGGSIGGAIGSLLSTPGKDGSNLIGKILGESAGKFFGGAVGSLILPGIGTIAGSLIGGLFGKKEDPIEKVRAPIVDLSAETKKNTEAIRQLNSTFDDLRSELINAPSRFVLPSQSTLGGRIDGGGAAGISSPIGFAGDGGLTVQFNISGNLDQNAANSAVQQLSELYDRQRRSGTGNKILRR